MGITTDTFTGLEFLLPASLLFQHKTYAAGRQSNIELLVSDLMINSMLKNTKSYFYGIHGMS